jgi:hypothetical protein
MKDQNQKQKKVTAFRRNKKEGFYNYSGFFFDRINGMNRI